MWAQEGMRSRDHFVSITLTLKQTTTLLRQLATADPGLLDEATTTMVNRLHQQADAKLHAIADAYPSEVQVPEITTVRLLLD